MVFIVFLCSYLMVSSHCSCLFGQEAKVVERVTKGGIEDVRVVVHDEGSWSASHPNVTHVKDSVVGIDIAERTIERKSGPAIGYDVLCVCTGSCPKRLCAADSDLVISLRDTDSVKKLSTRLENCRNVLIVGNGGIALDLVYVLCFLLGD